MNKTKALDVHATNRARGPIRESMQQHCNRKTPMKRRLVVALLTCFCASLARADFNPVALTPGSYTFGIVVRANTVQALPFCINVTAGNGVGLGDNTYYEQGLRARPGQVEAI